MAEKENKIMLSEQELFDVMSFAQQIYNAGNVYGAVTPSLLNNNLNLLNNKSNVPKSGDVEKALVNYIDNATALQEYTDFAESFDMIFKRILNYYVNMLSFNLSYAPVNVQDAEEYESEEFKADKRRVEKFLRAFDYKEEFRKVLKNVLKSETYYTWLRTNSGKTADLEQEPEKVKKLSKYTLQVMPQTHCMITGYSELGLLYDVDMNYFLKAGVDINQFDPIFKKYFNETYGENKNPKYNPIAPFGNRNGTFAMWHQTSPEVGAWAFKFDSSNFNSTPFLAPMVKNVLTDNEVKALQNDANIIAAHGILAGEIPLLDKQKSGQVADAMAWKPSTFKTFMQLVSAGLDKNVKAVAMPAENIHFYQYENKNPEMLSDQLKITSGSGASASRIIYSSDKVSQAELEAQITNDYNIVARMYSQFEAFLNYYINRKLKKYKYEFSFSGSTYAFINEPRNKAIMDLANVGIVLNPTVYAGLINMKPYEFEASLKEGHYGELTKLLTPLMSLHNQTKDSGRPKSDSSDLTDGGSIARDYDE